MKKKAVWCVRTQCGDATTECYVEAADQLSHALHEIAIDAKERADAYCRRTGADADSVRLLSVRRIEHSDGEVL